MGLNGLRDDLFMGVIEDDVLVLGQEGRVPLLIAEEVLEMVVLEGLVVLLEVRPRVALHCFKQDMIIWYDNGIVIKNKMVGRRKTGREGWRVG